MSDNPSSQRQTLAEEHKKYYLDHKIQHVYRTVKNKVELCYISNTPNFCEYDFAPYLCKIIMPSILGQYEVYYFDENTRRYELIGLSDETGIFSIPSCVEKYLNAGNMAVSPLGELFNIPKSECSGRLHLKFVFNMENFYNVEQLYRQGYTYEDIEFVPINLHRSDSDSKIVYNSYVTIRSVHHFSYLPCQTYYNTRIIY
jgi:hypothetical protein